MILKQILVERCTTLSGLCSHEILLGMTPTISLYESYPLRHAGDEDTTRDMMVADIRLALDLGASKRAADLLIVLRCFLSERLGTVIVLESPRRKGRPRSCRRRVYQQ
jgi:hypothetical protein